MPVDQSVIPFVEREVSFAEKAVICPEGEPHQAAYVVLDGQVKVRRKTPRGVAPEILKAGAVFGNLSFLRPHGFTLTDQVVADSSVRLGILNVEQIREEFEGLSPEFRSLVQAVFKSLGQAITAVKLPQE